MLPFLIEFESDVGERRIEPFENLSEHVLICRINGYTVMKAEFDRVEKLIRRVVEDNRGLINFK